MATKSSWHHIFLFERAFHRSIFLPHRRRSNLPQHALSSSNPSFFTRALNTLKLVAATADVAHNDNRLQQPWGWLYNIFSSKNFVLLSHTPIHTFSLPLYVFAWNLQWLSSFPTRVRQAISSPHSSEVNLQCEANEVFPNSRRFFAISSTSSQIVSARWKSTSNRKILLPNFRQNMGRVFRSLKTVVDGLPKCLLALLCWKIVTPCQIVLRVWRAMNGVIQVKVTWI